MTSELTNMLLACSSPDINMRKNAEHLLQELQTKDFRKYVTVLSEELADPNKPDQSVAMAGILLKNSIDAKGAELKRSLRNRWLSIQPNERMQIRTNLLAILRSEKKTSRDVAALVVAKIAAVELSSGNWAEVCEELYKLASKPPAEIAASAFRTLAILCEEAPDQMANETNKLFELCCKCLEPTQESLLLKVEAIGTLYRALLFSEEIFKNEKSCHYVMRIIFSSAESKDITLSVLALDCLARVADVFYLEVKPYVPEVLSLTTKYLADPSTHQSVVLRTIEFWAAMAEIEGGLLYGIPPPDPNLHLLESSLSGLVPVLLNSMSRQTDGDFDDEGSADSTSAAAGGCLSLVAQCVGGKLLPYVVPFLFANLGNNDWRKKEAALSAFGLLMECPKREDIQPLIGQAFEGLLHCSENSAPFVRDTSSWALAKVCNVFGKELIHSQEAQSLMESLLRQLQDERSRVAANACLGVTGLSEGSVTENPNESFPLKNYFNQVADGLVKASQRQDRHKHNLEAACYEALNSLILAGSKHCADSVEKIGEVFVGNLNVALNSVSAERDRANLNNFLALNVAGISTIIKVLDKERVARDAGKIMSLFFTVLQSQDKTIFEEVLLAIGILINKIGPKFSDFFEQTRPFVAIGLGGNLGPAVCQVSVGVVGDLFRSLGENRVPENVTDEFVEFLLKILQDTSIPREIKPDAVSCLGDIAIAVNKSFLRYFDYVMPIISTLSLVRFDNDDYEDKEFLNKLRASIFETFGMILHSLGNSANSRFVVHATAMSKLLDHVAEDDGKSDMVLATSLNFLGDLVDVLGRESKPLIDKTTVAKLTRSANLSKDTRVKEALAWVESAFSVFSTSFF